MRKIALILFFFFSSFANAQSLKALATTDSLSYNIGDYIDYSIVVFSPKKYLVKLPSIKDSLKSLTFLRNGKIDSVMSKDGYVTKTFHFVLSGYDSLKETIPAMTVTLTDTTKNSSVKLKTNEVNVIVRTLKVNLKGDIKDVKPPLTIPFDWLTIILILLGVLILLALIYFIYKKYFRKESVEEKKVKKIILPPHKIAYKKLSELESEKLWQSGKIKEFHSRITEILREYFENRYGFNSLEMTTDETLNELRKSNVTNEVVEITEKFLQNADMVKFAKFNPMASINEQMMSEAYKIVDLTKDDSEAEISEVS